jgi:arginine deiminase
MDWLVRWLINLGRDRRAESLLFDTLEEDTEFRIQRLATYNAEKQRGLMHTPQWIEMMEAEQAWYFNEMMHRGKA